MRKILLEEGGTTRTMSRAEVAKQKRQDSRTAIENIRCRFSADVARCEAMKKDLFSMFPL